MNYDTRSNSAIAKWNDNVVLVYSVRLHSAISAWYQEETAYPNPKLTSNRVSRVISSPSISIGKTTDKTMDVNTEKQPIMSVGI